MIEIVIEIETIEIATEIVIESGIAIVIGTDTIEIEIVNVTVNAIVIEGESMIESESEIVHETLERHPMLLDTIPRLHLHLHHPQQTIEQLPILHHHQQQRHQQWFDMSSHCRSRSS